MRQKVSPPVGHQEDTSAPPRGLSAPAMVIPGSGVDGSKPKVAVTQKGIAVLNGPGHGRPKGCTNKITRDLRQMILGALDDAGGQEYLARQAELNPGPFLALVGKVLPTTLQGPNGETVPIGIQVVLVRPTLGDKAAEPPTLDAEVLP